MDTQQFKGAWTAIHCVIDEMSSTDDIPITRKAFLYRAKQYCKNAVTNQNLWLVINTIDLDNLLELVKLLRNQE